MAPITIEQLRANVDQAMIYAPSKWEAHILRMAEAYETAYTSQATVLKNIEDEKNRTSLLAELALTVILPALLGGFMGAVFAGVGRSLIKKLADEGKKAFLDVAADTLKTVVSDVNKAAVRKSIQASKEYEAMISASAWKPTGISPTIFATRAKSTIAEFMTAAADAMNRTRNVKGPGYRNVLEGLYYGPFIRQAPETEDLLDVQELAWMLEVFLWVDWAKHRDVPWWSDRIMRATTKNPEYGFGGEDAAFYLESVEAMKMLDPVWKRLAKAGVDATHYSQPFANENRRFVNILWLRFLGKHYKGTMLGDMLNGRNPAPGDKTPASPLSIERRPKSYPLM